MDQWFRITYFKDNELHKKVIRVKDIQEVLTELGLLIEYKIIEFSYYHV